MSCALARHLGTDPADVHPSYDLRKDLGLDRLDLALVVLRLGEQLQVDVPFSRLDGVVTVEDLGTLVLDLVLPNGRAQRFLRSAVAGSR